MWKRTFCWLTNLLVKEDVEEEEEQEEVEKKAFLVDYLWMKEEVKEDMEEEEEVEE